MELAAIVVIPARDEQARIGECLAALAAQTLPAERFQTILVLDACRDATAQVAAVAAESLGLHLTAIDGPGAGPGPARQVGMDAACARLLAAGSPDGLIASTDADSRPATDWLERQLVHVRGGSEAVAGLIELDRPEAQRLPVEVRGHRRRDADARLRQVRRLDPSAEHHHFAGASLGVTARTYRQVGGMEPVPDLEDAAFALRLSRHNVAIRRAADVRVRTSARTGGRALRGLSTDLAVSTWFAQRRYRSAQFDLDRLEIVKAATGVTVIIPTKDCGATIAGVIERTVAPLADRGLVDELVVVDAASADRTAERAAAAGARVLQQDELRPDLGPARGKGDAMWRALQATAGEVVCFLDGDTGDPHREHLSGLIGPLLSDDSLALVKGAFERPLDTGRGTLPHEGGRVTELMARPLLNYHVPALAGFSQPLAGEFSARRDLLEEIPFPVGYGVEIAVLIDAYRRRGLDALAECHLGTRQNRHQPLRALGEMAYAVLAATEGRLAGRVVHPDGRYVRPWQDATPSTVEVGERPPIAAGRSRPQSSCEAQASSVASRPSRSSGSPNATAW